MEIGADGLDPHKTYLSKWLGGYGGADAKTFLNDGRPVVGIAGMRSRYDWGPAFCLCLVTTKAGALADADGLWPGLVPITNAKQRDDALHPIGQIARPAAATEPVGPPLRTTPVPPWHTLPARAGKGG
jgi:hypothetical protein